MRSNSLTKIISKTEARLLKLAREQQYQEGLEVIQRFHEKYGPADEILIQKAFFLYHYAAHLMYDYATQNDKKKALIKQNFEQAIDICKLVMKRRRDIEDRNLLNVRLYLAQIYAMLGRAKEAKNIARQTFKYHHSALTAERAADVHLRLNDLPGAIHWYKMAIKQAKKADEKSMAQIGLAIIYKQIGKTFFALKEALKALQLLKRSGRNKNVTLLKQSIYAHFPQLKKRPLHEVSPRTLTHALSLLTH